MRTLVRAGRRGVLVRVEEGGWTSFVLGGADDNDRVYFDLAAAVTSFEDIENGALAPRLRGERRRPLLSRLRRRLLPTAATT